MGMQVIREDVRAGTTQTVAGYDGIGLRAGNAFIETLARTESAVFGLDVMVCDTRFPDGTTRHSATLVSDRGLAVAHYYGEWSSE